MGISFVMVALWHKSTCFKKKRERQNCHDKEPGKVVLGK